MTDAAAVVSGCWPCFPFPPLSLSFVAWCGGRPFFLDLRKIRRDVTNGRPGVPLYLDLKVLGNCKPNGGGCRPKGDALVDIWHADSRGVYR